jgi:pimeloyl-ACP methyl ester carboxylesterase
MIPETVAAKDYPDPRRGMAPLAPTPDQYTSQYTRVTRQRFSSPTSDYCLYSPPAASAGLILYLHGYQPDLRIANIQDFGAYDAMLQYLAKSGFYVVYPYAYDETNYPSHARAALVDALAQLKSREKSVDIKNVAVAGHSHGGAAAIRVAARWSEAPTISAPLSALILHDTSGHDCSGAKDRESCVTEWDFSFAELEKIPCSTHLLIIQAEQSEIAVSSMMFWKDLRHIARYTGTSGDTPLRNYLVVRGDISHFSLDPSQPKPPNVFLPSTHLTPTVLPPIFCGTLTSLAGKQDDYGCYLTSMDFYGYWETTRKAVLEAFGGPLPADYSSPYCSSDRCAESLYMGTWEYDKSVKATPMANVDDLRLTQTYPDYCSR